MDADTLNITLALLRQQRNELMDLLIAQGTELETTRRQRDTLAQKLKALEEQPPAA